MILALNCGSSSLKYAMFEGERRTAGGAIGGIGVPGTQDQQSTSTSVDARSIIASCE